MSQFLFVVLLVLVILIGIVILVQMCDWSGEGNDLTELLDDAEEQIEEWDEAIETAVPSN